MNLDPKVAVGWRSKLASRDEFLVIYAGSMNEAYDIRLLLDAARVAEHQLPNVKWIFVGDGREQNQVTAAAETQRNIRYLGLLPKDDLAPLLLAADAAIAPHASWPLLDGCISGKLFDYMMAALPIVVLRDGQMSMIVRDSASGITAEVATAKGLVRSVAHLASLPESERKAMGGRGRLWVLRHATAASSARRVSAHVGRTTADAPVTSATLRLIRALTLATKDTLARRNRRAATTLMGEQRLTLIQREFSTWLTESQKDIDPTPLSIPDLLSHLGQDTGRSTHR
jgi:glycosyltransferase involved in cell wall biosynthesis